MFRLMGPLFARPTGFYLINTLIILVLHFWMTSPWAYFFLAGGILTFSYSLRRAIRQITGT